jgi:2-methylcitrate dehydratase PrpD
VNHGAVGCRYDPASAANPVVHVQFSAAYAFAVALATGEAGLGSFRAPILHDPALVALAQRITVVADDAIPPTALAPTIVELSLADGSCIARARERVLGSPEEPMAEDAVFAKFRLCLADGLGVSPGAADAFAERILRLDAADDATTLPQAFGDARGRQAGLRRRRKSTLSRARSSRHADAPAHRAVRRHFMPCPASASVSSPGE